MAKQAWQVSSKTFCEKDFCLLAYLINQTFDFVWVILFISECNLKWNISLGYVNVLLNTNIFKQTRIDAVLVEPWIGHTGFINIGKCFSPTEFFFSINSWYAWLHQDEIYVQVHVCIQRKEKCIQRKEKHRFYILDFLKTRQTTSRLY